MVAEDEETALIDVVILRIAGRLYRSRTLSINTYGADVKALTDLLVKHKYIARSSVGTNYLGYVVYDLEVRNAVRAFQKDAGLSQDGIAGNATITQLQTWVPKVYNLGDRVLKKRNAGRGCNPTEKYPDRQGIS